MAIRLRSPLSVFPSPRFACWLRASFGFSSGFEHRRYQQCPLWMGIGLDTTLEL